MQTQIKLLVLILLLSCQIKVEYPEYSKYFDVETRNLFLEANKLYSQSDFKRAYTLYTRVIANAKDKITKSMPIEWNPHYFRGHVAIELGDYQKAISDFEQVASDTTTNTDILLAKSEAFKMLRKYDETIKICNKLLSLQYDSAVVYLQRGECYYLIGDTGNACNDYRLAKQLRKELTKEDLIFFDEFLKQCK